MTERVCLHRMKDDVWVKETATLRIDARPFSEGACRWAYRGVLTLKGQHPIAVVCKIAKQVNTTPRTLYFQDVEAQECGRKYSQDYNAHSPPLEVAFVPAFVLELVERPGRPLCGCERFIDGKFRKYNNNVGAVSSSDAAVDRIEAETAQAFSHFTYERSNHQLLICDIQGFSGVFTDPQIHTAHSSSEYGGGNLGVTGIRAFLLRHTCNSVCAALKLPRMNAKQVGKVGRRRDRLRVSPADASMRSRSPRQRVATTAAEGQSSSSSSTHQQQPVVRVSLPTVAAATASCHSNQHDNNVVSSTTLCLPHQSDDEGSLINESDEHLMDSILRDIQI